MLGREATSAVMFIPLIVLYMSATGAILFPFCKEFIKSCRNDGDNYPVPEWERGRGEVKQRQGGSGTQDFSGGSGSHLKVTLTVPEQGEALYSHRKMKALNSLSTNCLGCTNQLITSYEVF